MEAKTHREEPKINWAASFEINEPLHELASSISGIYTRLSINFPQNISVKFWDEQSIEWYKYYKHIGKMNFKSEEEGELEIKRIGKICREMLELEQDFLRKSGRID